MISDNTWREHVSFQGHYLFSNETTGHKGKQEQNITFYSNVIHNIKLDKALSSMLVLLLCVWARTW